MKKIVLVFTIVFTAAMFIQPVFAESNNQNDLPWERFSLNIGGFITTLNSDVRLGGKGTGIDVNLEEALGMDTSMSVFRLDGMWRFTRNCRHRLDLSWYDLSRSGTRTLLNDIEIDDTVFPAGTKVSSSFDLQIFQGAYSYSFFQDDRFDLGASLGLYVMKIAFEIHSTGLILLEESARFTAPLPVLGLHLNFAITPKLILKQIYEILYLEYKQFKGAITTLKVALEYNAFKHVGFGLGLDSFRFRLEADGEDYPGIDFIGNIDFKFSGVLFYTKIYF